MKNSSNLNLKANVVKIIINDEVVSISKNTTCNVGLNKILERLTDINNTSGLAVLTKFAYGTGSTQQTIYDTSLENETGRVDIMTSEYVLNDNQLKVYSRVPIYGEVEIREMGLFMGENEDILLARTTTPASIIKKDGEAMTIEWTLNLNNS